MKPTTLIALTILLFSSSTTAPAFAEQKDWMQLMDPDRMIMLDENSDSVVDGNDWVLMSAQEKEKAVDLISATYFKVTRQIAGKPNDITADDAYVIKNVSMRVVPGLNLFYSKRSNRSILLTDEVVVLYNQEVENMINILNQ